MLPAGGVTDGAGASLGSDLAEGPRPGATSAGAEALRAQLAAASPGERAGVVEEHVARIVATVLDAAPERLDRERPLSQLGLDSLMAVELMTALQQDLGVAAPLADLLRWASLADLAEITGGQVAEAAGEALATERYPAGPTLD